MDKLSLCCETFDAASHVSAMKEVKAGQKVNGFSALIQQCSGAVCRDHPEDLCRKYHC